MDKYRTSVPVHLTRDQIMVLRDMVIHSDLDNTMRNDLINELAAGLLRFGSPIWENKVKIEE